MTPETPTSYTLTPEERAVLANLNQAVVQRKLAVYELNMKLEVAMKERDVTDSLFQGALAMIANSHGFAGGQLAPDFATITRFQSAPGVDAAGRTTQLSTVADL